jgi:hypothetical protein
LELEFVISAGGLVLDVERRFPWNVKPLPGDLNRE